jgi:hypothetical protein
MKASAPPKEMPPFQRTAARGMLPTERRERSRDQQAAHDVLPHRDPVHDEVMADRGPALLGPDAMPDAPFRHFHVHLGVPLHLADDPFLRLILRLRHEAPREKRAEEDCQEDDHEGSAHELGEGELPTKQDDHDDRQLDDEIRGCDLEGHGRREARSLAEHRARDRDRGIRAGRRGGAESTRDGQGPRPVVPEEPRHLALGDHGLDHPGDREAEDERPEDLPEHRERHPEGVTERGEQAHGVPVHLLFKIGTTGPREGPVHPPQSSRGGMLDDSVTLDQELGAGIFAQP